MKARSEHDSSSKKSNRSPQTEEAYSIVRTAITSGELQPGERLYVATLARRVGMSRTPVRGALQRLTSEGLLAMGAESLEITSLSLKDVRSLQQVNRALQGVAARLAANEGSEEDMARLEELMTRMENYCALRDLKSWTEVDVELHRHVFTMSKSPWLARLLLQIEPLLARGRDIILRQAGWMEKSTGEHRVTVNAIRSRGEEAAEKAMQDHLLTAEQKLIAILETVLVPWRGDRN